MVKGDPGHIKQRLSLVRCGAYTRAHSVGTEPLFASAFSGFKCSSGIKAAHQQLEVDI